MDIFQLLKKDHQEAKQLFKRIESGKGDKLGLFSELRQALMLHMEGEEKYFYPVLKKDEQTRERTEEGIQEHREAKKIIREMQPSKKVDEQWESRLEDLKEAIDHHIEEEEHDLFEKAKSVLSKEQSAEMAQQFQQEKQQKMASHG